MSTNEPIAAPSPVEDMPTQMYVKHKHAPHLKGAAPGDPVSFVVHGHVHSNRAGYGDDKDGGEAQVDIHKIEAQGAPKKMPAKKKKNAANAPMDELKEVIKAGVNPDGTK